MSAIDDLTEYLNKDERIEGIVFGAYSSGYTPFFEDDKWELEYNEPNPPPVPFNIRGKVLTLEQAKPYMIDWDFYNGTGVKAYATYIWTNQRIIFVTQYDGETELAAVPRNPINIFPEFIG